MGGAPGLSALPDVSLVYPVQANEVFLAMPEARLAALERAGYRFYRWDAPADGAIKKVVVKDAAGKVMPLGLVDGHAGQIGLQLIGVAIAWVLAIVGSLIALKIADMIVGVRVTQEDEQTGLDLTQHGEEGYLLEN